MLTTTRPITLAARERSGDLDGWQAGWPPQMSQTERAEEEQLYQKVGEESRCPACGRCGMEVRPYHVGSDIRVIEVCACGASSDI